ncbi:MAG: hypothetical protein GC157_00255 [Frankiales bacterium]|nr:hypothetical protein [Frankiales bacterium]
MTLHTVALLLAYLGSAIGVAMVVPQIVRIVRHPSMPGVSPWAWAMTAVACSTWLTYGVRTGSLPQIPGNVLLISGAVTIVLLVPAAWPRRTRAVALLAGVTTAVAVSTHLPAELVGFLAFGLGLVGMWPQVIETVWLRRGMGPSALSLTSNALKVGSQLCWLSFALLTTDVPVVVSALMALSTNAVVSLVELSRRRTAALGVAPRVLEPA